MSNPERLFHCTTPKKAKLYGESGMVYQDSQKCDH